MGCRLLGFWREWGLTGSGSASQRVRGFASWRVGGSVGGVGVELFRVRRGGSLGLAADGFGRYWRPHDRNQNKKVYYRSLRTEPTCLVWFILAWTLAPFLIWAAIYLAARQNIFTRDSMFRVLRVWRWIAWTVAVGLWLFFLLPPHIHWQYGACANMFSLGLSFPESWLKARLSVTPR